MDKLINKGDSEEITKHNKEIFDEGERITQQYKDNLDEDERLLNDYKDDFETYKRGGGKIRIKKVIRKY